MTALPFFPLVLSRRVLLASARAIGAAWVCGALALGQADRLFAESPPERPLPPMSAFRFRDVAEERGLFPALDGIQGHAAGWGDVDGDGAIDLYVGTFFEPNGKRNLLLRGGRDRFQVDPQPATALATRASAAVFADWDNDGDLDLYVSSMPRPKSGLVGCRLLENTGGGQFRDISDSSGACPAEFGGRSAATADFDGDGWLDLAVGEDPLPGYNGSPTKSSRLFRNLGGLKFVDASRESGIPEQTPGLGVAAGDLNGDGWPDLFLASHLGGNRLLINDGRGRFVEPEGSRETFQWADAGGDNMVCGVAMGDVNRDGLADIVLGQHFKTPWVKPVANRLYLNRGPRGGSPRFEDVTIAAGLDPLPLKAPHVEIQDFDNDGWPDLSVSIVKFAGGNAYPYLFRHLGGEIPAAGAIPKFKLVGPEANDFPTDDDRQIKQSGAFFKKMIADGKVIYMAPGPTADFDNDGRLDMFLPSWWPERRSLLLRNETIAGHGLQVSGSPIGAAGGAAKTADSTAAESPDAARRVNRQRIGTRIELYIPGRIGDPTAMLGCRELSVGFGYASAQPAIAHFGLGPHTTVDVRFIAPHGGPVRELRDVRADQRIAVLP
ncbi:MAG: CRTAC1 family protein [Planctomycetota bacterium]